jgi:hypothetical protein
MEESMKRLLPVLLLMLCLSFPAFAGHTVAGGAYCECGTPGCIEDYPGECGRSGQSATQDNTPKDVSSELGIVIVALLLWLRLKA